MIWIKVIVLLARYIPQTFQSDNSIFQSYIIQLRTCLNNVELLNCVKNETIHTLDSVLTDTSEWQISDLISVKTNKIIKSNYKSNSINENQDSFEKSLKDRISKLFESRHLEIKFHSHDEEGKAFYLSNDQEIQI